MLIAIPPIHDDEALNGYLLRLAEANGLEGIRHLLEPCDVKPRASYTAAQLAVIAAKLELDFDAMTKANLALGLGADPAHNARYAIGTRLAACPLCVAGDGYIRAEWLNFLSPVCAHHGVRLVDRCGECGAPLTWRRASLSGCDCGALISDYPSRSAPPFAWTFSAAIHGKQARAGAAVTMPGPFEHGEIEGRDHLAWFFACHAASPAGQHVMKRPLPSNTDEAIEILERDLAPVLGAWPEGLHALLRRIDEASPQRSAGIGKQLGTWYRGLHQHFEEDRFQWVRDEAAAFAAAHLALTFNGRVSRIPKPFGSIKGWLSVAEAARQIGVAPERLRGAISDGQVPGMVRSGGPERDFKFIRRPVVEALCEEKKRYVDARAAMRILGVNRRQFQRLLDAGGVQHRAAGDRPPLVDDPYCTDDLEALTAAIAARTSPWSRPRPDCEVRLADIVAARGRGEEYVLRAYQAIIRGDVAPRCIIDDGIGLGCFVFDRSEIEAIALPNPLESRMTLTQLCEVTGWKHESVAKWVSNGFLQAERIPNGATMATLISVEGLVRFLSRHVILAEMAHACDSQSRYLSDILEQAGCEVQSFQTDAGVTIGSIASLADLGAMLQDTARHRALMAEERYGSVR